MSTPEQPAPAIGSPEWYRTLPATVYTRGDLAFSGTHVWTDDKGNVKGQIELGAADLTFRTPAQVRDLIGHLVLLAGEMEAEIRRQQPAGPFEPESLACERCGVTLAGGVLVTIAGVTRCHNHPNCAGRVAARDTETAQVTTEQWKRTTDGTGWETRDSDGNYRLVTDQSVLLLGHYLSIRVTDRRGLAGAKPPEFCRWVLDLLGYLDEDAVDDLFPGTGVMGHVTAQGTLAVSP